MIIAIIQARTGSTRLPGKVLMELGGMTVIEQIVNRLKPSKYIDNIVVATTNEPSDDTVHRLCLERQIPCFRGSETDVLDRYYQCAKDIGAEVNDFIVRITGDCPMIDYEIIDKVIKKHIETGVDYTSNGLHPSYPDGLDVEIMGFRVLEKAYLEAKLRYEREHVTQYITRHPELFKLGELRNDTDLSAKRWTLDEKEDYELIRAVYDNLYNDKPVFLMRDVLDFLSANPELERINQMYERNEGLKKSIREEGKG